MLWYKGWLETRFKLLASFGYLCLLLAFLNSQRNAIPSPGARSAVFGIILFSNPSVMVVACAMLAGAGIVTQPAFLAIKGIHGSTLFTLSLPVSRLRLFLVRASLGWLEVAGAIGMYCWGMWLVSPQLRTAATALEMFEYAGTLIASASVIYFFAVLLSTFLDGQARIFGTIFGSVVLGVVSSFAPIPASLDIVRAIGEGSPLIAHALPSAAIALSLGLAAILFFAALRVAQTREY